MIVPSCDSTVYALHRRTGRPVWRFEGAGGEYHSSPVVEGKTLFAGNDDGNLYALALVSGEKLWSARLDSACWSKPLLLPGRVAAATLGGYVYSIRRTDGAILWRARPGGKIYLSNPELHEHSIVIGLTDGRLVSIDGESGKISWAFRTGEGILGGPTVSGGSAYLATRKGLCLRIDLNRRKAVWSRRLSGGALYQPAVFGNRVAVGTGAGLLYVLDGETGEIEWRARVKGRAGHCATDGKFLFLGCWNGDLRAFRAKDGAPLWNLTTGGDIRGFLTLEGGFVFAGSLDGSLYAVRYMK